MIFKDFGTKLLGSKTKVRIVLYFLGDGGAISERELGRRLDISHVAVGKALKELRGANLLRCDGVGNVNIYAINTESYAFMALKDIVFLAHTPPLFYLRQQLESDFGHSKCIKKVVLFGSIAQGLEMENSDIDVFLLLDRESDKKSVMKMVLASKEKYRKLFGNELSIYTMTNREMERASKQLVKNIEQGVVIK